jgi:site-specific DNA-methyltransferase (adenine-specific)
VKCDALITDTPYSDKTHSGHNDGARCAVGRRELNFRSWKPADVEAFVDAWAPRTRGWFVSITDHVLAPVWTAALERHGRYVFSPLAFLDPGSRVRRRGDGPAQWATWIVVARPRTLAFARWGALPGGYPRPADQPREKPAVVGGKPLWFMRALVRDYSRRGNLVCDPCAGAGTTLRAAVFEGRHAVGAEPVRRNFGLARRLLAEATP